QPGRVVRRACDAGCEARKTIASRPREQEGGKRERARGNVVERRRCERRHQCPERERYERRCAIPRSDSLRHSTERECKQQEGEAGGEHAHAPEPWVTFERPASRRR